MIKLYSDIDTHNIVLELWGGSTRHPDSVFHFEDFKQSPFANQDSQIFQWVLECASILNFPFHARELAEFALECDDAYIKYCDMMSKRAV